MHPVIEKLGKETVLFDGGMGTQLQAKGLKGGELPEMWNLEHPEIVYELQKAYVDAGCEILKTNTFGGNALKLKRSGHAVAEIVTAAMDIAHRASGGKTAVALDIGPLGRLLEPFGDLPFEDAYELFKEMVVAGRDRADLVIIETMTDIYEVKAAMLAVKENSDLPMIVTCTFDANGRMLTGSSIEAAMTLVESLGAAAVGINCSLGPEQMEKFVPRLLQSTNLPVVVNPNAGLPVMADGKTTYPVGAEEFSEYAKRFYALGVAVFGGCCGTTPDHIRAVGEAVKGKPVVQYEKPVRTVISSHRKVVTIGARPVLIGERINPTGKPDMEEMLRDEDYDSLCDEATEQVDEGAEVLDINLGLAGIDEEAAFTEFIPYLQTMTDVPLAIDTLNMEALEAALRLYNGKPLVNSVTGADDMLHKVLPLVKKYGAAVVGLTMDERGIPQTAEERVKIAEKIIRTAESYGIKREDVLIDTVVQPAAFDTTTAQVTLTALKTVRETLKVQTVLGISNVSYGLPKRTVLSAAFFTLALQNGLSAGIVNPLSRNVMNAYRAWCVLGGFDEECEDYIDAVN
ncbi:MAG: homocysteine S-methyltransferase family protein [Clostridia bacterium]|nr:homocysteine S-methyltransferase family protein [Clostridia bacterium]